MSDQVPIEVTHLFQPERQALLDLLRDLDADDWSKPTACEGWSVKGVALHLLGGDIGIVSSKRDHFHVPLPEAESFVDALNLRNAIWVEATARLSPELLIDLLDHVGAQAAATFESLDPSAIGPAVYWAGPEPAPVWLDVAREYTERWHHQQHIRDAVNCPELMDRTFAGPVIETFVQALPWSFHSVEAEPGTIFEFRVTGEAGGCWWLTRDESGWWLGPDRGGDTTAAVELPVDVARRMFTDGLSADECEVRATISGDRNLARALFVTRAIIV